jgi:hypothetical protein
VRNKKGAPKSESGSITLSLLFHREEGVLPFDGYQEEVLRIEDKRDTAAVLDQAADAGAPFRVPVHFSLDIAAVRHQNEHLCVMEGQVDGVVSGQYGLDRCLEGVPVGVGPCDLVHEPAEVFVLVFF